MKRYIADELGLPPAQVMWFLGTLSAAILISSIWLYQDKAYPHGPMYFTGEVSEVCQYERDCGMIPEYKEDTSQLNNSTWVTFIRNYGFLFFIPTVSLGILALVNGNKLVVHFRIRRRLLVLDDQLRLLLLSGPSFDLLFNIFKTNLCLRRWTVSKDFLQRARDLKKAEVHGPDAREWWDEFLNKWQEGLQTDSNSLKEINWPTESSWEISSLEQYIRDEREGITTWADDYDKDEEPDELEQAALDLIESAKYEIENYGQGGQYRTEGISISKEVEYKISSGIADLQTAIENGDKSAIEKAGDSLANALPDDYSWWPVE